MNVHNKFNNKNPWTENKKLIKTLFNDFNSLTFTTGSLCGFNYKIKQKQIQRIIIMEWR